MAGLTGPIMADPRENFQPAKALPWRLVTQIGMHQLRSA